MTLILVDNIFQPEPNNITGLRCRFVAAEDHQIFRKAAELNLNYICNTIVASCTISYNRL
jgi:hypothetical protein